MGVKKNIGKKYISRDNKNMKILMHMIYLIFFSVI